MKWRAVGILALTIACLLWAAATTYCSNGQDRERRSDESDDYKCEAVRFQEGGFCLPKNGSFSIYVTCTSLTGNDGKSLSDCTTNTRWTIETKNQLWYNNESKTTLAYTPTKGGVMLHYNYTGKGDLEVTGNNKGNYSLCKLWYLQSQYTISVCQCCTFIPNNTHAGGRLTVALEGLRTLNKRLKDQSGVDTTLWDS